MCLVVFLWQDALATYLWSRSVKWCLVKAKKMVNLMNLVVQEGLYVMHRAFYYRH